MNARSNSSIAVYLFLVFVSGIMVGAFGYRLYTVSAVSATSGDTQQARRQRFVAELQHRLALSNDQVRQLDTILNEGHTKSKAIHMKIDPEMTELRHQQDSKIRTMLDERQRTEFDRWKAEQEKAENANSK